MNELTIDEMWEGLKAESEENRNVLESADKTIELIQKLIDTRKKLNLSQEEVAKKCNMKQSAIARIEAFKIIPKINTYLKIANALGIFVSATTHEINNLELTKIALLQNVAKYIYNSNNKIFYNNGGYINGWQNLRLEANC